MKGQKYVKNMPENNQTTLYALSTDKQKTNTQRITNDHVLAAKSRVETREI